MKIKAFLLLVFVLLAGVSCKIPDSDTNATYTPTATESEEYGSDDIAFYAVIFPGAVETKTKTGTTIATPTPTYSDALNVYGKNGARFQFNNCTGMPGSLSLKVGNKFMLDNRDSSPHKMGIGSKIYLLKAYDFAIVTVQKAGTYSITCDGGGAAQITVQN